MSNQVQVYTPEAAMVLAKERFGTDLRKLSGEDARMRMIIKIQDGFNPYTDMTIYEGEAIITVDGYCNAVKRAGRRITGMPLRPVPKGERELYGLRDDQVAFLCDVYVEGSHFATGLGTASRTQPHRSRSDGKGGYEGGNPVERLHPARQAEARAIKHGLRQVLQAVGTHRNWMEIEDDDQGNTPLGEVIEGEVTVLDDDTPPEAPRTAPEPRAPRRVPNTPPAPKTAPVAPAAQAVDALGNESPRPIPPDNSEQPSMLGDEQTMLATDGQWETLRRLYRRSDGIAVKSRQELMTILYQTAPGEFTPPHNSLTEDQALDFIAAAQG